MHTRASGISSENVIFKPSKVYPFKSIGGIILHNVNCYVTPMPMDPKDERKISDAVTIGSTRTGAAAAAAARMPAGMNLHLDAILQTGQVIGGRFQILDILGVGGMGAVYKAYDQDIDRIVALKCIRPELASQPEVLHRFTQELLLTRQVAHKNVIRIFDVRESGGLKFITMEYVEGRDLGGLLLDKGKLPPSEALDIIQQACSGLAAAHAEGVIHRDLKPSNIMIDRQGRVVVMDFGVARAESGDGKTQTGAIIGTLQYMSPEQGKGEKIDARSDVFTIGLILYEMITGQLPYRADTPLASLLKRTQEAAAPVASIDATIPRSVSAIVARCLERDPQQRYQSMDQLTADIDSVQGRRPLSVFPVGVAAHGKLWMWIAIASLAVAIAAGIALGWFKFSRTQPTASIAPIKVLLADFDNATADSVFDGTLESSFALSLEGAPFISTYNRATAHKTLAQIKPGDTVLGESNASLVAVREGVNVVISGSVHKQGDGFKIECKAVDPVNTTTLGTASTGVVPKSGVLQAVAELAGKMRRVLGDTTPDSVRKQQEETVTASSLEAVHEYALGQNLQLSGKWEEALKHYSQAVALDQNMGRAYAGMAVMSANLGKKPDAENYYQRAMAHIDRMTDREKYRTRGGYYLMTRQPEKAIQEYDALVHQYPADSVGAPNLALAYFYMRDMVKAMEAGRRAADLSPKALVQRNNYALYSVYAGEYAAGAQAAQEVLQQDPNYVDALGALAMAQTGMGDLSNAAATYAKLQVLGGRGASVANIGLADIDLYQGHNDQGIVLLEKGIAADIAAKDQGSAAIKSIALAQAYLSKGDKGKAMAATDQAVKLSPDPSTLMAAGDLYISLVDLAKAGKLVTQLSAHIEPEPQIYGLLLQGNIALKKNQIKDAIQAFQSAQKISNTWLGHFYLGKAYLQNASFTESDSEFELCLKRRGEASAAFLDDVPTFRLMPPVYYYLGRAQEGLKSPAADDSYRSLIKLQPDSTSELVTDARRRLQTN
jgi:eukaryotic-like serine/threonine-protein kinase